MQLSKKMWMSTLVAGAMTFGAMYAASPVQAETYNGVAYVAGMGGHFAVTEFKVDTSSTSPIAITNLDKMDIGDSKSHPVHDARIDYKDRNTMYWSTYKMDPGAENQMHIGKSDLTTGEKTTDVTVPMPEYVTGTDKVYCASGQTPEYFFPISMSSPGFITVARKSDMKVMHQIDLAGTDADFKVPYKYLHGTTSPDMKELLITANESVTHKGDGVGKLHLVVLDTAALEQGKIKVLRKGVALGNAKSTISFRQYYSPDGKYIANATGDILHLIDAKTLETIDAETVGPLEQLHDAIFTPDGKFVIATSRSKSIFPDCADPIHPKPDEYLMDGHLKLYDVEQKKFIGKSTSTCLKCHDEELGRGEDAVHAVLCGLDVNWK
jgi:hypothetical protein